MPLGRSLLQTVTISRIISRNAFTAKKPDPFKPNMFRVGLAFGSTVLLWALLFKQHNNDMKEYKARNGLEIYYLDVFVCSTASWQRNDV